MWAVLMNQGIRTNWRSVRMVLKCNNLNLLASKHRGRKRRGISSILMVRVRSGKLTSLTFQLSPE